MTQTETNDLIAKSYNGPLAPVDLTDDDFSVFHCFDERAQAADI
ncbi:MAG: hypothetical protein QM501_08930 [Gimesia sp.]